MAQSREEFVSCEFRKRYQLELGMTIDDKQDVFSCSVVDVSLGICGGWNATIQIKNLTSKEIRRYEMSYLDLEVPESTGPIHRRYFARIRLAVDLAVGQLRREYTWAT